MTSRLDEIFDKLTDDVIAHPVGGGPAASHNKAKHQLLDLFEQLALEVIGITPSVGPEYPDSVTQENLRLRQRTRLEKLIKEMKENKNSQATRSKPGR